MGFAVLFFVLSGAVGHYTCRYNGISICEIEIIREKKMTSLTSLVFFSSTNEHFEGKKLSNEF